MKILFLLLLVLVPAACFCQLAGKVISIADGDTFTLLTSNKQKIRVRLYGIDCPEKGQDYAQVAKDYLGDLIFFDTVQVVYKGQDQFGRTLGIVTIHGINVNERMLKQGMAWHFIKYDSNSVWTGYENTARKQKKGLWAKPNAVAPWNWRGNH